METINNRVRRLRSWARLKIKLKSGLRDEGGAAAVFFAVGLVLLAPAALGLVDVYLTTTQRAELQDALDTATLYAARSEETDNTKLTEIGQKALLSNLKLPDGQKLIGSSFTLDGITITGTATVTPPGIGPELWARAPLQASSEVLRNSNNVEVAMVLDTTGSMNLYMSDLRTAAKDLVDLVVKDTQTPYYTKVALVPYSVGVNMGPYAQTARGTPRGATAIGGASQTDPVLVTSNGHGLSNGERVRISGVQGMTELNDKTFSVHEVTENTFKIKSISNNGVESWVNGSWYRKYTSGGVVACRSEGCERNNFTSASTNKTQREFSYTSCATERLGDHAYDDVAPSVAKVGWNYASSCPSQVIMPLSSSKTALRRAIDTLDDAGSTAGQIGLAWGWYMISPEWKSVWPAVSAPADYDKPQTVKVVILMTDGAFNSPYCKGVIASDAGPSSGSASDHINCTATNGDPFAQAAQLCTNMKRRNVVVYTVGFNVGDDADVRNLMQNCATSAEYVYMPGDGQALKVAFRAIAQDINSLRISK